MQGTKMRTRRTYSGAELDLVVSKSRELLVEGILTRKQTIGEVLPQLFALRESDVKGRAEILATPKRVTGKFMLSPSGAELWTLKPTTRTIDGVKRSMLSIKGRTSLPSVLSFELKDEL